MRHTEKLIYVARMAFRFNLPLTEKKLITLKLILNYCFLIVIYFFFVCIFLKIVCLEYSL